MLEQEYKGMIEENLLKQFSSIYVIDVLSDKVSVYDNDGSNFSLISNLSFFEFVQSQTNKVHKDDVNTYFDNLSINKLNEKGNYLTYQYRYLESDSYNLYTNFVFASYVDNKKLIIAAALKSSNTVQMEETREDKQTASKINEMSNAVSDTILKIYNTLDSTNENKDINQYIMNLLDNLIRQFPEFNSQFEKDMASQVNKTKSSLLIVDDDLMSRNLIKKTFVDEYDIILATNGKEAIDVLSSEKAVGISGIFLDLLMPVMDGFAVLSYLKENNILSKLPVIIISGAEDKETRQRVYEYNIADLLEKPFNLDIIKYRTKNLINLYKTSTSLNNMVFSQHKDLMTVVDKLVEAYKFDNKDKYKHLSDVFKFIATKVKDSYPEYKITDYSLSKIDNVIDLYDVGLYTLPKTLGASGTLNEVESKLIRDYPNINKIIVEKVLSKYNDPDLTKIGIELALYSREEYNGTGYPQGLKEDNIPIFPQIISLSSYIIKLGDLKEVSNEEIISKYFTNEGTRFNPKLIEVVKNNIEEIKKI